MSKLMPLSEAIADNVRDGDCVYAAGFTHLIPFAAGHEIIRQGQKDLVLARATPDLVYDQMVAAGCARKLIFSYMGNPGVGSGYRTICRTPGAAHGHAGGNSPLPGNRVPYRSRIIDRSRRLSPHSRWFPALAASLRVAARRSVTFWVRKLNTRKPKTVPRNKEE